MCFLGGGVAARRDWERFEIPMGWEIQFQNSSNKGFFWKKQKFLLHKSSKGEREYRREDLFQNEVQTGEWYLKT